MRACERLGQCPKVIRVADVVLAHERDEASAGVPDAEIAGGGYALVRLLKQTDRAGPGIFRNDGRTAVSGTVIDNNNFGGGGMLVKYAVQGAADKVCAIMDSNDHRDGYLGSRDILCGFDW